MSTPKMSTSMLGPKVFAAAFLPLALSFAPGTARAADAGAPATEIQWDKRTANVAGTSCVKGIDSFVLVNGNDVSFVFSNLGVALDFASPEPTAREMCSFKIQAQVGTGFFPGEVTQSYEYGVRKTSGAAGSLEANIRFFGFNVSPLPLSFPAGTALDVVNGTATHTDLFSANTPWTAAWCRSARPLAGALTGNLTVQGDRGGATDSLVMFVHGLGLKYDLHMDLASCGP